MPCGCTSKKGLQFVYTDEQGRSSTHDNELKAKVAQIRAGGKGTITQKPKG